MWKDDLGPLGRGHVTDGGGRVVWSQVEMTYGQPFDAYLRYYLGSAALVQGDAGTARVHLEASLRELEAAEDDLARGVVHGPGSPRACRCCAGAATSGTWPCSC